MLYSEGTDAGLMCRSMLVCELIDAHDPCDISAENGPRGRPITTPYVLDMKVTIRRRNAVVQSHNQLTNPSKYGNFAAGPASLNVLLGRDLQHSKDDDQQRYVLITPQNVEMFYVLFLSDEPLINRWFTAGDLKNIMAAIVDL